MRSSAQVPELASWHIVQGRKEAVAVACRRERQENLTRIRRDTVATAHMHTSECGAN